MTAPHEAPKILIVDDQPRNLDALEVMLAPAECTLVRALSADEALLALLRHEFAAMVLDIQMPGMNGLELARLIKQRKRSQHVPILFLTAHMVDEHDALLGYGAGAVDYLSKPINPEILRSKIGVFVELFRKTRELERLNEALRAEIANRETAQAALLVANQELERRVEQRTAALTRAAEERERLLEEAREARDDAQRQGRVKDEFLATLSHELRTPMNVILGWLAILESGKPLRDVYAALAVIRRNAAIQAQLIDDLLDMNRLASGNLRLELGQVDVGGLAQTTIQGLRPAAETKGVQLIASIDSSIGPITGDARRLQQVLWNLVHNAIKFTAGSGRVEIRVHQENGRLHLAVHDNGCGIAPDFLPHVFERFRQADASTTRGASGLGLGLAIAKHLVELHGGTIQAWSAGPGSGSTFVAQIPTAPIPAGASKESDSGRTRVIPASA